MAARKSKSKRKSAAKSAVRKSKSSKKPAAKKVSPIPKGYHSLTPYLVCRDAIGAIAFYKKALGAKERARMLGPDGKVMHAEILIGESMLMLGEENMQMNAPSPLQLGGSASGVFIYAPNVDKLYASAIAAGAKTEMPPADMFWGDRYCKFVDPYGHKWSIATHIEDVSPKEMERRGREFMAQQAAQGAEKP
jgi:PhnB protein